MPASVFYSFCRDAEFILASAFSSRPALNADLAFVASMRRKPRVCYSRVCYSHVCYFRVYHSCDATPASAIFPRLPILPHLLFSRVCLFPRVCLFSRICLPHLDSRTWDFTVFFRILGEYSRFPLDFLFHWLCECSRLPLDFPISSGRLVLFTIYAV